MRRNLHILLVFSLLFLSWYHLAHELTAHAGQSSPTCEICVFTGYLGHGAPSIPYTPPVVPVYTSYALLPSYAEPAVSQPFLLTLNERGPPSSTIA